MTPPYSTTGQGRRQLATPGPEESVQHPADPPIYRELLDLWASKGQTLPGRRDPEWSRLAAPLAFAAPRPAWGSPGKTTHRTATINVPWPTAPTNPGDQPQGQRVSGPAR
ncbi:hypothetical protein [Streptomyces lunaelactis]|uniref:hypothetical protein n=1 Tax=Streptomyces lunaelactis TaxID=1535768 RepID=UPI0020C7734C|nr:hypothetical protein [Streptomyces lunaelactis]